MSYMKIKDLFNFEKGILQSSKCIPGNYDFITASSEWKTHNEFTHDCEALIFAAAASGSLGRTHYVNGRFISSDLCFIITPKDQDNFPINLKFYHLIFQAFKDEIVRNTKAGTSKEAIGLGVFGNYLLPYFNIELQKSVQEKFIHSQQIKLQIDTELTHQLDLVKKLRQQLLQDAVQGKLLSAPGFSNDSGDPDNHNNHINQKNQSADNEQKMQKSAPEFSNDSGDSGNHHNHINQKNHSADNEHSGHQLLQRIKAEKAALRQAQGDKKKEKELPPIKPEEIPFDIPENWVWCKLGEITTLITSGSRNWNKYYSIEGALFIRSQNIKPTEIDLTKKAFVKLPKSVEGKRTEVKCYDILITITGAGVSNSGIYFDSKNEESYISQHVALVRLTIQNTSKWVHFCIISEIIGKSQFSKLIYGDKPGLNLSQLNSLIIPLPPLSEQTRIVEKLDELMKYCDELEASIKESQAQNEKLLQQVLREALRPGVKEKV